MPKEAKEPNSMPLGVRVTLLEKEYVERRAKEEDRSVAYMIRKFIRAAMKEELDQRTLNKS